MKIRKEFKFCAGHIVRNCTSKRCSQSIHGHNFTVEVFFEGDKLDKGQMVMDFGLAKNEIKDFIDAFDHSFIMWNKEVDEYKDFFKKFSKRWVELPVSPSAESLSITFASVIRAILGATEFANGESVRLHSVRVHETDTGYAEVGAREDFIDDFEYDEITFSPGTFEENLKWWEDFMDSDGNRFFNELPEQQIK